MHMSESHGFHKFGGASRCEFWCPRCVAHIAGATSRSAPPTPSSTHDSASQRMVGLHFFSNTCSPFLYIMFCSCVCFVVCGLLNVVVVAVLGVRVFRVVLVGGCYQVVLVDW